MRKFHKGESVVMYDNNHNYLGSGLILALGTYSVRVVFRDDTEMTYPIEQIYPDPCNSKEKK